MDPADQDAVRCTLEAQEKLLGKHDQLLTDIWTLLQTLNASVTNLPSSGQAEQVPPPVEAPRAVLQPATTAPQEPHVPIPERYSDKAKIAFVVTLHSRRVVQWAMADFMADLDHPVQSRKAASQILSLCQGSSSLADYSTRFCILVARSR
ncbi:hypothetical protein D4764_13G0012660 [Takifugu flavidus]|uniref:Retrotransposon gag domain-containing protein n=1 Tax=Takifugu flavidus TaxID=433684 RepID=A0A5C6P9Z5_9TELE|nr:hypothetical protein D4764_13G0012660 [Takifugu flavidus]